MRPPIKLRDGPRLKRTLSFYDQTRQRTRLWSAWHTVHAKARQSKSKTTRVNAERFDASAPQKIERLARRLQRGDFKFLKQRAVLIPKGNGAHRPLVVAPIPNRIVQRALLLTLQEIPSIASRLTAGFNFGGVPGDGFGVPGAVLKAFKASQTHPFFIRTDIRSFFTQVPRELALARLLDGVTDEPFRECVRAAVTTELDDATEHLADSGLFPLHDEGVAQGSCLSPLLCNLLLHEFDVAMNGREIVTVRYIDDIILFSKSERSLRKAFDSALGLLKELNLTCYDPRDPRDHEKAEMGRIEEGATFLGCFITPHLIRPSPDNYRELITTVRGIMAESRKSFASATQAQDNHLTYAETLVLVSKTVRGWANAFGFCTEERLFKDIDRLLGELLSEYELSFYGARSGKQPEDALRLTGIFPSQDRTRPPSYRAAIEILGKLAGSKAGATHGTDQSSSLAGSPRSR